MYRVKLAELTEPQNGLAMIYVDYWWPVSHDDEVYFFGSHRRPVGSPQCNANKKLAEEVSRGMVNSSDERMRYENFKEIRQIPLVFVPASSSDYIA